MVDSGGGSQNGATQLNLGIPLPVALPSSAMLGGVLITVGPEGVASAGANAFAHTLLVRAQQRRKYVSTWAWAATTRDQVESPATAPMLSQL